MISLRRTARLALVPLVAAACGESGDPDLTTFTDSASYALGVNIAVSIQREAPEVNLSAIVAGLRHQWENDATALTETEVRGLLQRLARQAGEARREQQSAAGEENLAAGMAFLAENGQRPGVVTTASGLQYEIVTQGAGRRPAATDRVRVHYRGTLIDGTEFDASDRAGPGASFAVNGVIPGWAEGVQLMAVGSTYKLYLPPHLAYGPAGSPPDIGPNATLIFEVELLAIE